jgi:hypothetical protein
MPTPNDLAAAFLDTVPQYAGEMSTARASMATAKQKRADEVARLVEFANKFADQRNTDADLALRARSDQLDLREAALNSRSADLDAREKALIAQAADADARVKDAENAEHYRDVLLNLGKSGSPSGLSAGEVLKLERQIDALTMVLNYTNAELEKLMGKSSVQ